MTPGEFLKNLRINAGLTQQEVAKRLEISRSLYANIEADIISPRMRVTQLAEFFNVSSDQILGLQPPDDVILTPREKAIYKKYQNLPKAKQLWVLEFLEHYTDFESEDKK